MTSLLAAAEQGADGGARLDGELGALAERLTALRIEAEDLAAELRRYEAGLEVEPGRLDEVEGRLDLYERLEWPDQQERWARIRSALEIARTTPARVVRAGAAEFLSGLTPTVGQWTVVWHSVMWQYLDGPEQARVTDQLERTGALAGPDAPVAHIGFEPYGSRFLVTARTWPDVGLGVDRLRPASACPTVNWCWASARRTACPSTGHELSPTARLRVVHG